MDFHINFTISSFLKGILFLFVEIYYMDKRIESLQKLEQSTERLYEALERLKVAVDRLDEVKCQREANSEQKTLSPVE